MDDKTRTYKIIEIFKKLNNLNLGISGFEEFDEFRKICNHFIRTGESKEGQIKVLGTKRIICYNFDTNKVDCMLKYDENV